MGNGAQSGPSARRPKVRIADDERSFVREGSGPYVPFGVNYYRPGTGWAPQVWKRFDADATRRDFERIRELGGNAVRVFLTYGSFYMKPGTLIPAGLEKFERFLSLADEFELYVHPTGPDHWEGTPEWARHDPIADEIALDALEAFWDQFAARYRGVNTIFAYDLRNEPSVGWDSPVMAEKWADWVRARYGSVGAAADAWGQTPFADGRALIPPPKPSLGDPYLLDYQRFREHIADEWTRRQTAAIKAADSDALVSVGAIQWAVPALLPNVRQYAAFRPSRQARFLDFLEVHFYPLADGLYQYRGDDERDRNLAYLESIVREVAAPGKPVVIGEFGWYGGGSLPVRNGQRTREASEEDQAEWCASVIDVTAGLATGWLNWGLYDQPEARDVSVLTGLLTADGQLKAWGRRFQQLAAEYTGRTISPARIGTRPAFDWDAFVTDPAAAATFRDEYLRAFRADTRTPQETR